ncbi:aminoacyltransferase [Streptococcus suis]|uniref:aminoacyltransferase n=1 Tax=Streptococcus suis TaxID=1307 RepID=UPI000CF4EAF5|nr:aminoacyltransferase [Streptococcus suis]
MFTYKIGISAEEHDQFVKIHEQVNLLQSSSWAKIKDNWGNERLGFYQDDSLVAVASVLIRPLPAGFSMLYIPRGPIMDYSNQDLVQFVLASLKKFGKIKRALFIKFDPALLLKQYKIGHEVEENPTTLAQLAILHKAGAEWTGRTQDMAQSIQPRFQANIHRDYFSDETLSKSTRQTIRTSLNKGLVVQVGGVEWLDEFAALMKKTEKRKSISLRDKAYYEKILTTYPEHSFITITQLDLDKRYSTLLAQKEKLTQEALKFTEKTKPGKRSQNREDTEKTLEELAFLEKKLAEGHHLASLAATLSVDFGPTSDNLYAGMDEEYRRYQPAILTWYETARQAFNRGASWQNMGGIENQLDGGLFSYKSKFNPLIEEYLGEFTVPVNRFLYKLTTTAYTIRKQLRNRH